jgi:hypothetical protein
MPRKSTPKYLDSDTKYTEMPYFLDHGVIVVAYVPKDAAAGAVRRQATHNTFSIETGDGNARKSVTAVKAEGSVTSGAGSDPVPQVVTAFVSHSTLTDEDLIKEDAELRELKERNAPIEEVEAVLAERNTGAGPKPRSTRGREIAKAAAGLRRISVDTPDGHVDEVIGLNGSVQ